MHTLQFLHVWNPNNAEPIVMERVALDTLGPQASTLHTKSLYRLSDASRAALQGCTDDMATTGWSPRGLHWEAPEHASPPDDTTQLRHASVAYQ